MIIRSQPAKIQEMHWKQNQTASTSKVKAILEINFTISDFHLLTPFKTFIKRNQILIILRLNLGELPLRMTLIKKTLTVKSY